MNLIEMRVAIMKMAVELNPKGATMKEVNDTYDAIFQKLTGDLVAEPIPQKQETTIVPLGKA